MLAVLSSSVFDPDGWVPLNVVNEQTEGETFRRLTRTATLDGGSVLVDGGFSDADRTIELSWAVTNREVEANVKRLVTTYEQVKIAVGNSVYLAAPERYTPGAAESQLRLFVISKLSG